jgi:predicted Na+-dependent transporter
MVEGVRNAPTTRSGFILVSNYAWMCVVVAVTIARFGQGYSHKVELGPDDAAIVAATVRCSVAYRRTYADLARSFSWEILLPGNIL